MPYYPELSIKNLYNLLKEDTEVLKFLPDKGKRWVNREFVWNVVNTLRPEVVKHVVYAAMERRRMRNLKDQENRKVLCVKAELLQKLDQVNLLRSK